jgi:predicted GNAT superfamily acetyltransferase
MATGQGSVIETRAITTIPEFEDAVHLQKEIWGFADVELLPRRLFVVANKVGGHTFAAFDGEKMVSFLIAIPGIKSDGSHYLHSHMLGTMKGYRDRGLGRRLKLLQREEARSRGIELVEWTFDPLEIKNAFFNIERLGAIVNRYVPNQYGTTSSHLHGGLPTDRCVAEWWLDSPRVRGILDGPAQPRPAVEARVVVPANIAELRQSDQKQARDIQQRISEEFLDHFRKGLTVTGFEITPQAGTYLLGQWQSK